MKLKYGVLAGFVMASTCLANIQVQWSGLDGFVKIDGSTPLLSGGASTIAYLVFSPSGLSHGTDLSSGSFLQGDEMMIGSFISTSDEYGTVFTQDSPAMAFQSGFIYARVFDAGTTSDSGQPLLGTYYYEGPSVAAANVADPTAPQIYNMNTGSAGIDGFMTDVVNRQVVPEPSVIAFLGLGGLALAARRRFVA